MLNAAWRNLMLKLGSALAEDFFTKGSMACFTLLRNAPWSSGYDNQRLGVRISLQTVVFSISLWNLLF